MHKSDNCNSSKGWLAELGKEEIESAKRGLADFEEGRIHSHDTVRKIYEKYLEFPSITGKI